MVLNPLHQLGGDIKDASAAAGEGAEEPNLGAEGTHAPIQRMVTGRR